MSEKYYSEEPGFEDCFIEVSDNWTMKEVKAMGAADEVEYFEIFNKKVESMYLKDTLGVEWTNPKTFKPADVEEFDLILAGFIGTVLPLHCRRRKNLGGANVRLSSSGSATTATKTN